MPAHDSPHRPRNVLIADDNRDSAESLAQVLRFQGHQVRMVFDGQQALDEFNRTAADVVLLDIGMPKLSGIEVARLIRHTPQGRDTLLIAITGWGQQSDRSRTREAGFDHHLTKPVDLSLLTRLINGLPDPGTNQSLPAA
ncbi:response regulator [Tahibacter amnicola]|uniref:Response regulator n=1 Tax=Tahibacter amnicola TaxID=2976241 RepID=A0ABY6BL58_9GAMM|nr:response regulator [Tahibacter amnicola]UXI69311.1 response regulator [Tahibacter amnicola]